MSTNKRGLRKQDTIRLSLGIVIVVLLNVISSFVFTRFDLTSEKRYTLAPTTKKLITGLNDVIFVKVYLDGEFPAGFKRLRNATREMLDEFRVYGDENIQYEFINPFSSDDKKEQKEIFKQLTEKGLIPSTIEEKGNAEASTQVIFPGAILSYRGKEQPLNLLPEQLGAPPEERLNSSIEGMEYGFADAIRKLIAGKKPRIGFLQGHGELGFLEVADIVRELAEFYAADSVRIDGKLKSLDGFDALVIAKPETHFNEMDKYVIDQFIMRGGRVLWAVDAVKATMDSLAGKNEMFGITNPLNLDDMLFKYGARLNPDLVLDLQAAPIPISTGQIGKQQLFPWYYFPLVFPNGNHPIINNLNAVRMEFAGSIDTVGNKSLKKTVLLASSRYSRTLQSPVRINIGIAMQRPEPKQYNKSYLPLAVLLEGEFESVFVNRLLDDMAESKEIAFRGKSKPGKMVVVADGDVIRNPVHKESGQPYPLGYDIFTRQTYGNKNFLLNAIDYMLDESGLIAARSKEIKLRLLDKQKITTEETKWQLVNTVLPVGIILIFGIIKNIIRKKTYAR